MRIFNAAGYWGPNVLYRNEGNGTFMDVTQEAGVYQPGARGLGVVGTDYNNDGDKVLG